MQRKKQTRAPARANKKARPDRRTRAEHVAAMLGLDISSADPMKPPRKGPTEPGQNFPVFERLLDALTSDERKQYPITTGFNDYFTDAVAEVARVSFLGNEKHNPGQPLHWSRGKSADHADCIARHLTQRGTIDVIMIAGKEYFVRHSAALAWRALALLQEELEWEKGYSLPRGATSS